VVEYLVAIFSVVVIGLAMRAAIQTWRSGVYKPRSITYRRDRDDGGYWMGMFGLVSGSIAIAVNFVMWAIRTFW
jgi:hypothetical protein